MWVRMTVQLKLRQIQATILRLRAECIRLRDGRMNSGDGQHWRG
jgi:hypothetical protein